MPQEPQQTESPASEPSASPARPTRRFAIPLAIVLALVALAAIRYHARILDRFRVNRLYYMGHLREWDEAYQRIGSLSLHDPEDPYALRMQLEILLHLGRTSEALDLIDAHRPLFETARHDLVGLQQTAAFVCILTDRNRRAAQMLRRHKRSRLSAAMVRLIEGAPGKADIGPREIDRLDALIEDEMVFRGPYNDLARYLFARRYIDLGQIDPAIELLEGICERYPHVAAFHYDLAEACLEKRRFDRATIHFVIAHKEMRRRAPRAQGDQGERTLFEDEEAFCQAVLEQTLRHAATHTPGDFWRLLRGLDVVLPRERVLEVLAVAPHRLSLAGLFERAEVQDAFDAVKADGTPAEPRDPFQKRLLSGLTRVTGDRPRTSRSLSIAPGEVSPGDRDGAATLTLRTVSIVPQAVGILSEGSVWSGRIPAASDRMIDGAVLIRLRSFPRRDVYGGCRVRVGTDLYWVYPMEVQWFAFPMPPLPDKQIEIEVTATEYGIPGYTERGDADSRRIHVEAVLGCYLEDGKADQEESGTTNRERL
ncbi:tetratricopeptide repeat protein [Candidatus Sumerlaeota bacterium]|nr:tetratricopeptide repeat protein [Candidatus Sumerlaeota bacterium]